MTYHYHGIDAEESIFVASLNKNRGKARYSRFEDLSDVSLSLLGAATVLIFF